MKRLADSLNYAKRFKPSHKFCTSFCLLFLFQAFPSYPLAVLYVKLSWGLNYPSPLWLEELHANRKAVALQGLAVRHSSRGTKLSVACGEDEPVIRVPPANANHARSVGTDILRKRRFRSRHLSIPFEVTADLHGDSVLSAMERIDAAAEWGHVIYSQARSYAR